MAKLAYFQFKGRIAGLICLVSALAQPVSAQTASQQGRDKGQYIPNIWVDPDGCEHWVMDDGAEGFMTPNVTPDGIPVCREMNVCGLLNSDQAFASGSATLNEESTARLIAFFQSAFARGFIISGHTDNVGTDASNLRLSRARAEAVASLAQNTGASVSGIQAHGERKPRASNATPEGQALNRRVEIICLR